ncbi:MAG TPA: HD domain-containing protein [Candidatus Dormibacteraeota bacterium]|nr:HD domain-containing protein [Candidatus Dormibacteraeota bacterium]
MILGSARRFAEVNLIADPLYGYIEITKRSAGDPGEQGLLDSPWLQRLRRIHQLQSAWWVFPTAEHSRFSHLLGAMHLASLFARQIDASLRESVPGTPSPALVESTLRLAGLLHDCGHGPFGHFFDREVLAAYGIDHEDVGRHLVEEELADLITSLRGCPAGRFEAGEAVDPRWVSWVMAPADIPGFDPPAWLRACKPLLCGPATVDNLDYVRRDAYMCGVSVGSVDVERLLRYTFVSGDTVVLHGHATGALQMFLEARLFLYLSIYFHRTVRRIDLAMREIFAETIGRILPGDPRDHLDAYADLTDWGLLETVRRWTRGDADERRLADGWRRITERKLRWRLAFEAQLLAGTPTDTLHERIADELGRAARGVRFTVDVAAASVAPSNPMDPQGLVAIYDPLRDCVERGRTDELFSRLPRHNAVVRVFVDDEGSTDAVNTAARRAIEAS